MHNTTPPNPPLPRGGDEITRRSFLGAAAMAATAFVVPARAAAEKRKLVLIAGRPSHGALEHEFNGGVALIKQWLADTKGLEVAAYYNGWPDDPKAFDGVDGILCFADGGSRHPFIERDHLAILDGLMKKGVGLMCAHYAVEIPKEKGGKELKDWIGGYYETNWSVNPVWKAEFETLPEHPVTRGVKPFYIRDEWYFNMRFRPDMEGVKPILIGKPSDDVRKSRPLPHVVEASGRPEVLMWCVERPDGGRGLGFTGAHYHLNFANNDFRKLFLNSLLWITKVDVPADGVVSSTTEEELKAHVDPKPERKPKAKKK